MIFYLDTAKVSWSFLSKWETRDFNRRQRIWVSAKC